MKYQPRLDAHDGGVSRKYKRGLSRWRSVEGMTLAKGTFEVQLTPRSEDGGTPADGGGAPGLSRFSLDKTFAGDLVGTSAGQMLAHRTATEGSAGYVALERIQGRLADREGAFVVQHLGVMHRGENTLTLEVVPDSGQGGLEGLEGSMTIEIEDGVHHYTLTYTLPE